MSDADYPHSTPSHSRSSQAILKPRSERIRNAAHETHSDSPATHTSGARQPVTVKGRKKKKRKSLIAPGRPRRPGRDATTAAVNICGTFLYFFTFFFPLRRAYHFILLFNRILKKKSKKFCVLTVCKSGISRSLPLHVLGCPHYHK